MYFQRISGFFRVIRHMRMQNNDIQQESNLSSEAVKDTIEFRGEIVTVPHNFPQHLLNQSYEEFDAYYTSRNGEANVRTNTEAAMDLFNTLSARTWMESSTSWGNTNNWGVLYGAKTGNFQHLMYYVN